jgi:hypothetical protein
MARVNIKGKLKVLCKVSEGSIRFREAQAELNLSALHNEALRYTA